MEWYWILAIILGSIVLLLVLSIVFYKQFFKRFYDIFLSGLSIVVFSPILLVFTIIGAIKMKGNPFFVQERPGKNEKIFKLIKFRSMTCEKDKEGNLLPDEKRLTKYGQFIRKTSIDELPEIFNIFIGDMSVVGPRPLLVKYLDRYNETQKHRHDVRPGLTGYAQANGRNAISWEEKFEMDVWYTTHYTLFGDVAIIIKTFFNVIKRKDIESSTSITMEEFMGGK